MDKKQEFLKRILATFAIEAEENIDSLSSNLIELEKGCSIKREKELIEIMFRSAHSLKGASRAVNLVEIESVCHAFEDVMTTLKGGEIKFNLQIIDFLNHTVDLLSELLHANESINSELIHKVNNHIENLTLIEAGLDIVVLESVDKKEIIKDIPKEAIKGIEKEVLHAQKIDVSKKPDSYLREKQNANLKTTNDTIRVSTDKLDTLLVQAEEMLAVKLNVIHHTEDLRNTSKKLKGWSKEAASMIGTVSNIKEYLHKEDENLSNVEREMEKVLQFHEWTNSYLKDLEKEIGELRNLSQQEDYATGAKIEGLLNDVKELITVPFSTILDVFPKMIRDLSKKLDKKINFVIEGDAIEIDRRILENLKNPLMHILRISIDYGVESPEIRVQKGKTEEGTILLKIERLENRTIEIVISDDGAGLNKEKLKKIYLKNENISNSAISNIAEADYLNCIFQSGISTSEIVTDLSGRGLGLAIVQEAIEHLGGTISVASEEGKSCVFKMLLPVSIITFRGVLIVASGHQFIVPTAKVEKVLRLHKDQIKTVENGDTILFNEEIISIVNLSEVLEMKSNSSISEYIQIIILVSKNKYLGFIIDKVIEEEEVLVKKFNRQLTRVRNIAGATILGSGKVVPVLNISDLFKTVSKGSIGSVKSNSMEETVPKSVLVVEDSITSRTLIKNILEASGYRVTTAVDGLDGFTKLKMGVFDVVISDVEMPRMNGFDLTAKIRADEKYASIPVVLVTSLSKREHKEKGIDVGANAYIVKSSFDQNNLIEILEKLI